jgi:hypothetical protein
MVRFGWPEALDPQVPVNDDPEDEHPARAATTTMAATTKAGRTSLVFMART